MKTVGSFFKSFAVFTHNLDTSVLRGMSDYGEELSDPTGSMWGTRGLVRPFENEDKLFHNLDGLGLLFCVQFNERILPGKVRDEQLKKRADDIAEREGRKIGKKEYAQLRDDVELELLPKAFIKRAKVFGLITPSKLLIFSASAKRQDDIVMTLISFVSSEASTEFKLSHASAGLRDAVSTMTGLALQDDDQFGATKSALLRIEDDERPTIRVKDKDIYAQDVQNLLKQGYRVHELGLFARNYDATFVLAKSMTIKRFVLGDDLVLSHFNETPEDFHGAAWLVCRTALDVWSDIEITFEDDEL